MDVIYVSSLCSKEVYNKLFSNDKYKGDQQIQKYHRLLVEGFVCNRISVITISAPPINSNNTKKKIINIHSEFNDGVTYTYVPTINIPGIKNLWAFVISFFKTFNLCLKNNDSVVICDVLNVTVSTGTLIASKVTKKKCIGIVTDLPEMQKSYPRWLIRFNNYIINKFSSYVFLTEQMNKLINTKSKPYIVIEGQVDINMKDMPNRLINKYEKKIIHFAGGLHIRYGLKILVEAFIRANIENAELHLYGSGDFELELKELCKDNLKVKYFGIVPNDYIITEQLKSTLLVNPRPTDQEVTKYSFPSKNMEYMASGTPVLTTKLPGMPKEYYDYVYLIEDETEEGIVKTLKEVLNKSSEELHEIGFRAKEFVIKEKNNINQAEKIIELIKITNSRDVI